MRLIAAMTVGCDANASGDEVGLNGASSEGKSNPAATDSEQVATKGEGGGEAYA